ncbi:MAG: hypothetical protein ACYC67_22080 [Prosthecobacter sp.]
MITITPLYPEISDEVTVDDISVLSRFAPIISEDTVKNFCTTSSPRWERDPTVQTEKYFRLIVGSDEPREILTHSIDAYRHMKPEKFREHFLNASFCELQPPSA